jgi:hypothetical protein
MKALFLAYQAIPFLVMAAAGLLLPLLAVLMHRRFGIGLCWLAVVYLADTLWPNALGLNLGINLFLADLGLALLGLVAAVRLSSAASGRPLGGWFYLWAGIVALNLLQGLFLFKGAAGTAARPTFYALSACAYAMSFPMDEGRLAALFKAFAWIGAALMLLVAWRGTAVAFDIRELLPPSGSYQPQGHSVWRVIASDASLLLAEVAVSVWAWHRVVPGMAGWRWVALPLVLVTLGLQHRSVWLAALAGWMLSLWLSRAGGRRGWSWIWPAALALAMVGSGLLLDPSPGGPGGGGGAGVVRDIEASARDAVALQGTAADRLGSWRQLVRQWSGSGPRGLALGAPFGTSMERYVSDDLSAPKVAYQPHNYYVETLVSQGAVGLLAYLAMYVTALRGLWRGRADEQFGLAARWLMVLLAVQLAYFLTYGVEFLQLLVLGASLSLAARWRTAPAAGLAAGQRPGGRARAPMAGRPP